MRIAPFLLVVLATSVIAWIVPQGNPADFIGRVLSSEKAGNCSKAGLEDNELWKAEVKVEKIKEQRGLEERHLIVGDTITIYFRQVRPPRLRLGTNQLYEFALCRSRGNLRDLYGVGSETNCWYVLGSDNISPVSSCDDTNNHGVFNDFPTHIIVISGQAFVTRLEQLIARKKGESDQELLTRFFKEQHVEIQKPTVLELSVDGKFLVVQTTTAENYAKIKGLLAEKFKDECIKVYPTD